ncbi:MAG TPA: ComEC/Rec2 family competence protein [Beijerinckiaceae bacterium]|jgi:competence protein ComEC
MPGGGGTAWRAAAARSAALALAGGAPWRAGAVPLRDWRGAFRACLAEELEQRRLFPWLAVAFGAGVLLYFAAEGRPALWAPLAGAAVAAGAAVLVRARPFGLAVALGLCAAFCGFAAGAWREWRVEAPVIGRVTVGPVVGFVETLEERARGGRLVIRPSELAGLPAERRPLRVRATVRDLQGVKPGDFVAAQARLLPLPEAARPGGYDFARDAYFNGIGAVGSLSGRIEVKAPPAPPPLDLTAAATIDRARNALTRRIADAIGGQAGAVAAALVTGKRGLITEETNQVLRGAGIYHIVSISGLHMVLAAGTFFWLARALLALSAFAALRWPIKKIAAVVAMAGAVAYCVFSGSEVATERSLIMILVMLGAILIDRPALSLRNLALSALIVLAREPETLLGPSFQMSYAAVAALIAAAEWERGRGVEEPEGRAARAARWLVRAALGILFTTVVATVATAPFGAYHFQNLQSFGLIGNALALPLVSLVVMPCAVFGVVAYPFGLDRIAWETMGIAVQKVLEVSAWVNGLSGSTVTVPAFGAAALGLLSVALLVATLMASPLRRLAAAPAALGLWLAATPQRFDVYVDRAGIGAAVRGTDGRLVLVGRSSAFTAEQWLKADGDARRAGDPALRAGLRCDPLGCVAEAMGGRIVALVQDRRAFEEDCARAAIVVTRLFAPPSCAAAVVIDGAFLRGHGATAIRFTGGAGHVGHAVATARTPDETRPWRGAAAREARAPPRPRPQAGGRFPRSGAGPPDASDDAPVDGDPN